MHPLTAALPSALAQLLQDVPISPGKVDFAWKYAVGVKLGSVTSVRLENGVLYVDAATPQWGREISRSAHIILPRLETLLGKDSVQRIEVRS